MSSRRNYRRMQHEIKSALREKFDAGRGTSKHLDKKANGGKPLMGKIYCDTTLDDYRASAERFARAAAEDGNVSITLTFPDDADAPVQAVRLTPVV